MHGMWHLVPRLGIKLNQGSNLSPCIWNAESLTAGPPGQQWLTLMLILTPSFELKIPISAPFHLDTHRAQLTGQVSLAAPKLISPSDSLGKIMTSSAIIKPTSQIGP